MSVPPADRHVIRRTVGYADLNELGGLSTPVALRWIEEAARAHAEAVGVGAPRMMEERTMVVVRQHALHLHHPARTGDVLEIETRVMEAGGPRAVRQNEVRRALDGRVLLTCRTEWVWIDPQTGRPRRPGRPFVEAYGF